MKNNITYLLGLFLHACFVSSALAEHTQKVTPQMCFENQMVQNPKVIAAKVNLNMRLSLTSSPSQPKCNPELTSNFNDST